MVEKTFVSKQTKMTQLQFSPKERRVLDLLLKVCAEKSPETILRVAGGYVRDKLLGIDSCDIDVAVNNMSGEEFAVLVNTYMDEHNIRHKGGISVVKANPDQSKHLATAMLNVLGFPIDFVNLRKETYAQSRIPVVMPGTPEEDASRRDLTINALFYNLNKGMIEDFVDGVSDLQNKIARTPIDPVQTFIDDPLRILRTVRFAAKYGLQLAPELVTATTNLEVQEAFRNKVSAERIWKELAGQDQGGTEGWKTGFMTGPHPAFAARLLGELHLRDILFGLNEDEMKGLGVNQGMMSFDADQNNPNHDMTIWEHTLAVLKYLTETETTQAIQDNSEEYLIRNLSALLHDIGKCDICSRQTSEQGFYTYHGHEMSSGKIAEYVLRRMRAPNNIIDRVKLLVDNHMRLHLLPDNASNKSLRRFMRDLGSDWTNSVDLAVADASGKQKVHEAFRQRYDAFNQRMKELVISTGGKTSIKPPISGHDLMNIGFVPGPVMGQALKLLQEELLDNPHMTKEEALVLVKEMNLL